MKAIYQWLTYAGSLPFIAAAVCGVLDIDQIPVLGSVITILSVYGIVIAAFMAGVHWGQHLSLNDSWQSHLAICSNVIAIVVWLGFIVFASNLFIFLLAIIFALLLLIDRFLWADGYISNEYFHTRYVVTIIVVMSLLTAGFNL